MCQGWKTTRTGAHFQGPVSARPNPGQHSRSTGTNTLIALNNEDPRSITQNT